MNFYRTRSTPEWFVEYGVTHVDAKIYLYDYMSEHQLIWDHFPFNENAKLIFDNCYEGWPVNDPPIVKKLHDYFTSHNFNLDNVFYISGNFREKDCYTGDINIVEVCPWDTGGYNHYIKDVPSDHLQDKIDNLQDANKNFIYLSRVPRPDRTMLTRKLFENDLLQDNIISHDVIEDDGSDFCKILPIIADTKDFQTNWANYLCKEVHMPALFSVVGETMQDDVCGTSLFLSEKSFRPMYLGMPMLIWGQPNINQFLFQLGYQPYYEWFDYGFDYIQDTKKRCDELTKQLVSLNKLLNSMTQTERIDWATKDMETLIHNRNRTRYNEKSLNNFKKMIEKINVR